jgi:hypothetical protein
VSRFAWLLVGLVLGAGAATLLARRTVSEAVAPAPAPVVERTALPRPATAPAGRHVWVPPGENAGPADR